MATGTIQSLSPNPPQPSLETQGSDGNRDNCVPNPNNNPNPKVLKLQVEFRNIFKNCFCYYSAMLNSKILIVSGTPYG